MTFRYSVLAVLALSACVENADETRVDVLRGKQLFAENCAVCHGTNAEGAGIASLGLGAPPPGLTRLTIENGGVFPRERVLAVIDGLDRHNNPMATMPEFGAGDLGPLIQVENNGLSTPTPAIMLALATYLESIQD